MLAKKYSNLLTKSTITITSAVIVSFIFGYFVRQYVYFKFPPSSSINKIHPLREEGLPYKFVHPLLAYETSETNDPEYAPLKQDIEKLINDKISNNQITIASVYFRDLSSSRWIGVNADETYSPASLLKIAILISYLKMSESGQVDLNSKLIYKSQTQIPYETPSVLVSGNSYSINDLLNYLITKSDNGAKDLLLAHSEPKVLSSVYDNLQLQDPATNPDYVISAKNYSLFLRVLYNATYLGKSTSEMALELLSQADYKDGLVAGLPSNIPVAHKFGEKVLQNSNGNVIGTELHDCGIIYTHHGDYILCIMTKGPSKQALTDTIKDISQEVYSNFLKLPED